MKIRTIMTALISCMTLGCSTTQGTAAVECGAGAAGSAFLLCKALGGDNDKCAALAAVGGAGGATFCYNYADKLEKRRQELGGRENDLDARIEYVRNLNQDAEQLNAQLRTRVTEVTQHTDEVVSKVSQGELTKDQLKQEQAALDHEIQSVSHQAAQERDALEEMKRFQARQEQRSQALDAEIVKQEQLLIDTERQTSALAAQRQRV
jgi:hypothetical protein